MSVYFMQEQGGEGLIKIGFSDLPDKRLTTIKSREAKAVDILAVIDGSREVERLLHAQLSADRHHGEWFTPSANVLAVVKTAQKVSSPKRYRSTNVTYDESAEDMRIAFELIHEAVLRLGGTQSRFATIEKIIFPRLHAINPMWTARRLRGLYSKENATVPHWTIRNLTELVEELRDNGTAWAAEWLCPELKSAARVQAERQEGGE